MVATVVIVDTQREKIYKNIYVQQFLLKKIKVSANWFVFYDAHSLYYSSKTEKFGTLLINLIVIKNLKIETKRNKNSSSQIT